MRRRVQQGGSTPNRAVIFAADLGRLAVTKLWLRITFFRGTAGLMRSLAGPEVKNVVGQMHRCAVSVTAEEARQALSHAMHATQMELAKWRSVLLGLLLTVAHVHDNNRS